MPDKISTAVFGGGCFWCTEAIFQNLVGVISVVSGYTGGSTPHPTYEEVCSGTSGHAEVIQITFDAAVINYTDLLNVFFATHDPTTLNQQGADQGTQYRSVIFFTTDTQKKQAHECITKLEKERFFDTPIVTQIQPLTKFYPAEDYHQNYYQQNKEKPYCQIVISPKLEKLKQRYSHLLKK